jgi:hypothetical protein
MCIDHAKATQPYTAVMRKVVWLLPWVVMCGGTTTPSVDAGPDTSIPCWSSLRTSQDRTCAANGDCAVLAHQTDCCGSIVEEGIRLDQVDAVHNAEVTANASCGACGCPPKPTVDESGNQGGAFVASCDQGVCTGHAQ